MAEVCPCSPIGASRCRKACRGCSKQSCGGGCPSRPIVKRFQQGVVMSGAGAPPHTACEPAPPEFPKPRCFLYTNWYDFENNVFYKLRKSATGAVLGYDSFVCGAQILNLYRLTTPDNIAAQGMVVSSGPVLNMVECLVPRANEAIASSSINRDALAYSVANANAAQTAARLAQCIARANQGVLGFVFGNPPTPKVVAGIRSGQGFTATPTIVLTPREFGFQVFVRSSLNGLYSRDPNNSPLTDPKFPAKACNGDFHDQPEFNLRYQFSGELCEWFLVSFICEMAVGCDAINQGLESSGFCEIAPNWRENCNCACDEKPCAAPAPCAQVEVVERIVPVVEQSKGCEPCAKRAVRRQSKRSSSSVSNGDGTSSGSSGRDSLLSSSFISNNEDGDDSDDDAFSD